MSTLVQYEAMVDEVLDLFLDRTEALYAKTGGVCNFARWLQFYAFDVIGQITYGKRHGFIDEARDVDGMVEKLGSIFSYVAPVQLPFPFVVSELTDSRLVKCRGSIGCS